MFSNQKESYEFGNKEIDSIQIDANKIFLQDIVANIFLIFFSLRLTYCILIIEALAPFSNCYVYSWALVAIMEIILKHPVYNKFDSSTLMFQLIFSA